MWDEAQPCTAPHFQHNYRARFHKKLTVGVLCYLVQLANIGIHHEMVYPLGVPNPIEIVATSRKLFKLYQEARGRQANVHAANELLSSIGSTIDRLEQAGGDECVDNSISALAQVRTARTAWTALHEHLQKFSVDEQSQKGLVPRARTVYDDLRWAVHVLDGKVLELKQELGLSLLAVVPTQIADLQ
ncbi:hypothetical protein NU219Hw_g580t1 [Hortaea werneckii]